MQCATLPTAARFQIGIEGIEEGRVVGNDVRHRHLDPMQEIAAVEAEPLEAIEGSGWAWGFDHQSKGTGNWALWRVAHVRWQHEDLAFADRHVINLPAFGDLQQHVPFELVEELRHGIIVEIHPLVGTSHHHDHHAGLLEDQLVADGRLQQMAVTLDPTAEIEGPQSWMQLHFLSLLMSSGRRSQRPRGSRPFPPRSAAAWAGGPFLLPGPAIPASTFAVPGACCRAASI